MAPMSRPLETPCLVPGRDAEVLGDLPQGGSRHHHFGESTVYETCLRLEVEPVRRMVLFSQRRPPEIARSESLLSFLQQGLERRLSSSTLKVYVATIAANHDPVEGKSVGKHDWVVRFLRGGKKAESSTPPLYTLLGPVLSAQSTATGPVRALADSRAQVTLNENSAPACTGLH